MFVGKGPIAMSVPASSCVGAVTSTKSEIKVKSGMENEVDTKDGASTWGLSGCP